MKRDICRFISIYTIFISIFLTITGCESTKSSGSTTSGRTGSKGSSTKTSTEKKVVVTPSTPVVEANLAPGLERQILDLVNDYRKTKKLSPLQNNAAIEYQARRHSMDMGTHRIPFGHQGLSFRIKYIQEKVPGAIGAQQTKDLAFNNIKADAFYRLELSVIFFQVLY